MDISEQIWLLKQLYSNGSYYDTDKKQHLHHISSSFSAADLAGLEAHRHLPNQMKACEHDDIMRELTMLTDQWTLSEAAHAFVAGLWSAPFLWQTALTAKLIALAMPPHEYTPFSSTSPVCAVCGYHPSDVDITLLWYQQMTGGTPLDGEPVGHVWALREMEALGKRPIPNEYDLWTFRAILTKIRTLPPGTRYSKAREELYLEKLLPAAGKWVYGSLLETLALIGILDTKDYPGMAVRFTTYQKREERPSSKVEVQAPLAWWDSTSGINEEVLYQVFGSFDCTSVSLSDRPAAIVPLSETVTGSVEGRKVPRKIYPKSPDAGKGLVEPGDVYAVHVRDDTWVTVYCHEADGAYAIVEYLDGVFSAMPAKAELKNTIRPRRDGRWKMKASRIDQTTGIRRIARKIPVPSTDLSEPDRLPVGGAGELKHLAHWCFPEL